MSQASEEATVKQLLEVGAHFGHRTSRWNPAMRPFIHSKRGGIHIIDLVQTAERMQTAAQFAEQVATSGKQILFVGTKKHIAPTVREAANGADMPSVTNRWFGGILTNFQTIYARIQYYKQLAADLESGALAETYNKRELLEFEEERDKLAESFGEMSHMDTLPGAMFVADVVTEKTAVSEANRLRIPVIGIVDTNADPRFIDYPIPANDDAVKTIALISDRIGSAIEAGKKSYAQQADTSTSKQPAPTPNKDATKPQPSTPSETAPEPEGPASAEAVSTTSGDTQEVDSSEADPTSGEEVTPLDAQEEAGDTESVGGNPTKEEV